MSNQPRFCELCGRTLRVKETTNYLWWACPKWPDLGEHWWSPAVLGRHTMLVIRDEEALVPKRFDRYTGRPVAR